MTYLNVTLPKRIASGFKGGPNWRTEIVTMDNGREQRNRQWLYPLYKFSASTARWTPDDCKTLISFLMVTAGRHSPFRFHDPTDYSAINEVIGPNIGTSDPVQLIKTYVIGAYSMTRLIQAPVDGTVVVSKDGSPITGTLDDQTGLFTPSAPWASGTYTWSGRFEIWVRLDSDWGAFTAVADNVFTADIDLVEVRR